MQFNAGNVLLDRLAGAALYLVPRVPYQTGLLPRMNALAARLHTQGHKAYLIPVGGSNTVGLWGYLDAMEEILTQVMYGKVYWFT